MDEDNAGRASPFGRLLRRHRIEAGLSQEALAERARMSVRGIGALERGDRRTPQRETLVLLADALQLEAERRRAFEAAGDPRGSRRVGGGAAAHLTPNVPASNLLPPLTTFVGRGVELEELSALVRDHRLVTVTGPGGIGKTRTALEVALARNGAAADGAWLADLAPIHDATHVVAAIASPFGVRETPGRTLLDLLSSFLASKHLLIVLDNCEHVIDEVRRVVPLVLQRCPDVRVLATSRESLSVASERLYLLSPLPVPPRRADLGARQLLSYDAPRLFSDRATASDARFAVTDENSEHVAEICRRLDGIPLALELAAARVRMFSPRELAKSLDDRFGILTNGDPAALPRQRTIRALIDWSYALLAEPERALFRRLSVFAGGFTLERAEALCRSHAPTDAAATLDLLSALVDRSLVTVETSGVDTRYRLLESIQEYARERLVEHDEHVTAARAHASAFLTFAEEIERLYGTAADDDWKARAEPDLDNWRAALAWCFSPDGDRLTGLALTAALRWVWIAFAQVEGRQWTQLAVERCDAETPAAVLAGLFLAEAHNGTRLSQHRAGREAAERAFRHLEPSADARLCAEAEWRIGNALVILRDVAEGERRLNVALTAYRRLDLPKMVCWVLVCIAQARSFVDDGSGARARYSEALAIARSRGYEHVAMVTLGNLADVEFREGDAEAALRCAREALDGSRRVHSGIGDAYHLCNIAAYLIALGRYAEARSHALEAITSSREARVEVLTLVSLQHLAAIAALGGRDGAADGDHDARAARLLGYVDGRFAALGAKREFTEAKEFATVSSVLGARIGADAFEDLLASGRTWIEESAFAEASLL